MYLIIGSIVTLFFTVIIAKEDHTAAKTENNNKATH